MFYGLLYAPHTNSHLPPKGICLLQVLVSCQYLPQSCIFTCIWTLFTGVPARRDFLSQFLPFLKREFDYFAHSWPILDLFFLLQSLPSCRQVCVLYPFGMLPSVMPSRPCLTAVRSLRVSVTFFLLLQICCWLWIAAFSGHSLVFGRGC